MSKQIRAARTKLSPGEDSIDRVVDALPPRGPYEAKITVRLWDGTTYRPTIRARTKGEFRRIAVEKRDSKLNSTSTNWDKSKNFSAFITDVSKPAIQAARLRPNTRDRYELALKQAEAQLGKHAIGEAVKFRTLERALQTIATANGSESARQARTVVSKYILDQLIREGVIGHNPLRGISIDLGEVKKGNKPQGGHALTNAQYDAVVDHLIARDTARPLPPGTDRRASSIAKHDNVVALALLQAGTGLRISEALAATRQSVKVANGQIAISITSEQSKTHRGRSIPFLDKRVEKFWLNRLNRLGTTDPLIPSPGDKQAHWRTDNAVKASAALFKDVGAQLQDNHIALMRSHDWRTVLNNRAIARGVPAQVRAAYFGHDVDVNARNYTDWTDVDAMRGALNLGEESGTQNGT